VPDEDDVPPELADEWLTQDNIRRRNNIPRAGPALHHPPDPVPALGPDPQTALEPDHQTDEPPAAQPIVEPPPPDPLPDPGVINLEPEHEIVFGPDTSDDKSDYHVDPGPDDGEEVDPTEEEGVSIEEEVDPTDTDNDEPVPHEEPLRRSSRVNRGVNRRHRNFLALTATIALGNGVHPTLAKGDGFLRTLEWDAPPTNSTAKALMFPVELTYD
jgi:hypothetical protein